MTVIQQLRIQCLRNITEAELRLHPKMNFIAGVNGSGKSSLLEAIHLLAQGRSFRATSKTSLISYQAEQLNLFTEVIMGETTQRVGIQKSQHGMTKLRINGEYCRSLASAAEILPVILINPQSYDLIEEGPAYRREYLDWILFHVEQSYRNIYQRFELSLKQRNAAIRQEQPRSQCVLWDESLIEYGNALTQLRVTLLAKLQPYFETLLKHLDVQFPIVLKYEHGWPEGQSFEQALQNSFNKDAAIGYTSVGPQRADIRLITEQGHAASDILSRGQEKLISSALLLAKALYYQEQKNNTPIILIDDLASELDHLNRAKLLGLLQHVPAQYLITATHADLFSDSGYPEHTMFHVEHGCVKVD